MRHTVFLLILALFVGSVTFGAVGEDFEMKIVPAMSEVGAALGSTASGSVDMEVQLTTAVDDVQGWSFGAIVDPDAGVTMTITKLEISAGVMTILNGGPAAFKTTSYFGAGDLTSAAGIAEPLADGISAAAITQGVVIDFMQVVNLDAVADYALASLTVAIEGPVEDPNKSGRVVFSSDIGSPPISTVVVVGGGSIPPGAQTGAEIVLIEQEVGAPFTIDIADGKGGTNAMVDSVVSLNFDANGLNGAALIQGWSYGICLDDPSKLAIAAATADGTDTATVKDGGPADFDTVTVYDGEGVTHGIVIDFMAAVTLPAQNDHTDMIVTLEVLMGTAPDESYVTACSNALGAPPVKNVMVIQGNSTPADDYEGTDPDACGEIRCNKPGKIEFSPGSKLLPGDSNADSRLDIADCVHILNYLFQGGPEPTCLKAADINDDDAVDSSDAVFIIDYLFLDGDASPLGTECDLFTEDVVEPLGCEVEQC